MNRLAFRFLWSFALASAMIALPSYAQQGKLLDLQDAAKVVQLAHELENDPFGKEAKEKRKWLNDWNERTDGILVYSCVKGLGPRDSPKNKYADIIENQVAFSEAAFIIENPELTKFLHFPYFSKPEDTSKFVEALFGKDSEARVELLAVYTAGLKGAISAYKAILLKKPKERWAWMDSLIERQARGERLEQAAAEELTDCSK